MSNVSERVSNQDIRDAFFEEIYKVGKKDKNVIFITDDLDSFVMRRFKQAFPKQFINIGVAEQNLMDVAAGLAVSGKKVFVYGICTYITMRCYEQIRFAIASMNLPVVIIGVGAGFSFSYDGSTHHGTCDIGIMRMLSEITILNPSGAILAASCAKIAYKNKGPIYVRLDKGKFPEFYNKKDSWEAGFKIIRPISAITIISTGYMVQRAVAVADELKKNSISVGVVDVWRLKPIDKLLFSKLLNSKVLITLEENSIVGGLGSIFSEIICDSGQNIKLKRLAVLDKQFISYGKRDWFHNLNNLDIASIKKTVKYYVKSIG